MNKDSLNTVQYQKYKRGVLCDAVENPLIVVGDKI